MRIETGKCGFLRHLIGQTIGMRAKRWLNTNLIQDQADRVNVHHIGIGTKEWKIPFKI